MKSNRILILSGPKDKREPLKNSLTGHELIFAENIPEAEIVLAERSVDLIISRVFLEQENMFDFLRLCKAHDQWSKIPFICFVANQSKMARKLTSSVAAATKIMGADGYLRLDDFCNDETCNYAELRQEIEKFLFSENQAIQETR